MALAVDSVVPDEIDGSGGSRLLFTGDFSDYIGKTFVVEFTPTGGGNATRGLSGVPGRPTVVYPSNADQLYCYSPALESGTYDVKVRRADDTPEVTLGSPVTIEKRQYHTKVFDLRAVWPPIYRVGPRGMDLLEPV